ncbi:DUF2642 domain-containing protein [Fictibacillus iocasae]|uniref:DUF2642 domain-containing protein n=1 Tax=Fictibacillus iocasae TaxID=2715437 RepID=A0ABW2NTD1_9BACL
MNQLKPLLHKTVYIRMTGGKVFEGILTDLGNDILVINDGSHFQYIPLLHIHKIRLSHSADLEMSPNSALSATKQEKTISYRSTLTNAKGLLTRIHVAGKKDIQGYITHVLSDYFTYYSPIYKTLYISFYHLKWLTFYENDQIPFSVDIPVSSAPLSRSWEEQLKKLEGRLVIFDMEEDPDKVGWLKKVESSMIELQTLNGETMYIKSNHLKTVYVP